MNTKNKIALLTKIIEALQANNDKTDTLETLTALQKHLTEGKDTDQTLNAIIHSLQLQEIFSIFSEKKNTIVKQIIVNSGVDYHKRDYYKWY